MRLESRRADALELLLAALVRDAGCELHVAVDETDEDTRRLYERHGFAVARRESAYAVPTGAEATGLRTADPPAGYTLVGADQVAEARLRHLDDALRQDVPGTDGWRWDEAGFREETFESPAFDPATYLVAVERRSRSEVGLVRVWNNPAGPRLGLIAVRPRHRRRGLAKALLARAFAVLDARGTAAVAADVDDSNVPSRTLLEGLGARRTGGSLELVRRHDARR